MKKNNFRKRYKKILNSLLIIFPTCLLMILSLIYLKGPTIKIIGDKNIIIDVNSKYIEQGYKANYIINDLTKDVLVESNINTSKIGNYTVTYSIYYKNKVYKKQRKVEVVDKVQPIISLNKDDNSLTCPNKEYTEEGYTAMDNYDGNITDKVTIKKEKDKWIYIVKDSSNNEALVTRTIRYGDIEKPTITLIGGNYNIYLNSNYTEKGYTASDNCLGDISDKVIVTGNVDTTKLGTYKIEYSVKDDNNNESTVNRIINVINAPVFINKTIYLTFDDGPTTLTSQYLDILKEEGVKATFFINDHGRGYDYLLKRMVNEGHAIGNHTSTHQWSLYKNASAFWTDVDKLNNIIYNITGKQNKIFRFPGGSSNTISKKYSLGIMTTLTNQASSKGYIYYDWTIDSNDAGGAKTSVEVYNNVVKYMGYNSLNIVLMHDGKNTTLGALRYIIKYGKDNGFTFSIITESTPVSHHHINN